jgi:CRISPR system Cascade subunit CasB
MSDTPTRQPTQFERFLEHLASQVGDRGVMADLRHGLSKATECRAWPHVAPWCARFESDRDRRIWLTIAAGFAMHQRSTDAGNMGTVMRALAMGHHRDDKGHSTFDARFRRFLACSSSSEVCDHLGGVLRASEREGVPVNFVQLFNDLVRWERGRAKVEWAAEYWPAPPAETREESAEEGEDIEAAGDDEGEGQP